jgi:hypothetical protein
MSSQTFSGPPNGSDHEIRLLEEGPPTSPTRIPIRSVSTVSSRSSSTSRIQRVVVDIVKFLLYCSAHLVFLPVIGGIYVYGAFQLRRYPDMMPDPDDWRIIALVGAFIQLGVVGPIYCACQPDVLKRNPPPVADWYGSIIFYCLVAFYFERVAVTFYYKALRRRSEMKRLQRAASTGSKSVRTRIHLVEGDIARLRQGARFNSTFLIVVVAILSGVEIALMRVVGEQSTTAAPTNSTWVNGTQAPKNGPPRLEFVVVMTAFWFLLLLAVNAMVGLGVLIMAFQYRLITIFSRQRRAEELNDIRDPQLVARWCAAWQGIIMREVQASPAAKSVAFHGSMFSILSVIASGWYLATRFLYPNSTKNVEDFHAPAILVLLYGLISTVAYCVITVLMQRAIEAQHRLVATVRHELTCLIDDVRSGNLVRDQDDLELLEGKSRVIHSLDRLLTTADPRARLFNVSLDSLRWTVVNVGLLTVNAFILQIFYAKCTLKSGGKGGAA